MHDKKTQNNILFESIVNYWMEGHVAYDHLIEYNTDNSDPQNMFKFCR